jgi:hypothetical protein
MSATRTFTNKKGNTITSTLADAQVLELLGRALPDDRRLADAYLGDYRKYGRLKGDQVYWSHVIAKRALDAETPIDPDAPHAGRDWIKNLPRPVPIQPQPERPTAPISLPAGVGALAEAVESVLPGDDKALPPEAIAIREVVRQALYNQPRGLPLDTPLPIDDDPQPWEDTYGDDEEAPAGVNLLDVFKLFHTAHSKLKFPRVTFEVNGHTLVLQLAGGKSKRPGVINVTDGGRYPNNTYFGYIGLDGGFVPYRACTPEVVETLNEFAADPVKAAAKYGKRSGNCCFCNKPLTRGKSETGQALYSTDLGYGETCAKNWGLPWGLAAAKALGLTGEQN